MLAPYRALLAWLGSAALLAAIEWALLLIQADGSFAGLGQQLAMLPFQYGNFLPYALGTLCAFGLAGAGARLAARRFSIPRARLLVAGVVAVALLPYSIWLARFTFSGPQARVLAFHALWVVLTTLLISLAFAASAWFHLWRGERQGRALRVAVATALATALSMWLSSAVLANEYEPLHAFLGFCSLSVAVLFGHEVAALARPSLLRFAVLAGSLGGIWAIFCGLTLARADDYAWIIWSHTATSRYVTARWPATRLAAGQTDGSSMPVKLDLESERTRAWRARRAQEPAPNIVLFSIDGLRYDHVGAYGYTRRPSTPNIDRFARRGARFDRAYTHYPSTKNFNTGLLLGRFAALRAHTPPADYREQAITRLLDRRGYHIFVKSWFEHSSTKSFDPKRYAIDTNIDKQPGPQTVPMHETLARISNHIADAKQRREPVFVWLHLLETHIQRGKFIPHPARNFGQAPEDRYDSAVAGCDLWLEHLEPMLERSDPTRPTIWIILSDHGTRMDSQGRSLEEYIVRVPLIIVAPGVRPQVIGEPVDAALDVAATIVDYAGIEPPGAYEGISLIPVLAMGGAAKDLNERLIPLSRGARSKGAVRGPFKFREQKGAVSLFNVEEDPEEKRNIIGEHAELAAQMLSRTQAELDRRHAGYKRRGSSERALPPAADEDEDEH